MGKIRSKKEGKKPLPNNKGVADNLGKISAEISAISLGPPRTKILKRTNAGGGSGGNSSGSSLANFASRLVNSQNKAKKKVTFCQNLVEEELREKSAEGEDAKHYFKVIHPSAIKKRRREGKSIGVAERISAFIPGKDILISKSMPELKRIIEKSVKNKKMRLKTKREAFKRKMELIKVNKEEVLKAKQREQTVIVGDMNPILESLPSLEEMDVEGSSVSLNAEEQQKMIPKKTKFSVKKTQKALMDSLKFFEAAGVGKTAAGLSAN